jgi:hypothetical protein
MFCFYITSLIVGVVVGSLQAIIFCREINRRTTFQGRALFILLNRLLSFVVRYIFLFAVLWLLFCYCRLNIFAGMVGFFSAFWGTLLRKVKGYHES